MALAAGAGDRAALERFVLATQREVWRLLAHLARVDIADDLTQETYLRAIPSLARFAARSSARTWLLSIARRVAVDHLRAARSRPRASPGVEDAAELTTPLDALAPERREALVLTQVLGLTYAEAAEVCHCPVGAIRSRVAHARDDLDLPRLADRRHDHTG